jgi:hypothetical protein
MWSRAAPVTVMFALVPVIVLRGAVSVAVILRVPAVFSVAPLRYVLTPASPETNV